MNPLLPYLDGAPSWFPTLLNLSLQAAFLALLVFTIIKTLGRWIPPNWRALLWFLVIARVLIPYAPPSRFSLQNFFVKPPPPVVATAQPLPQIKINFEPADPTYVPQDIPDETFEMATVPEPQPQFQPQPTPFPTGQALTITWSIGALFSLAFLGARCAIIRRRLNRHGAPPAESILETLTACRAALRLRYPLRVTASDAIAAPALTGFLPARLILPKAFATGQYTPAQIRHILLHELAHLQHGHLLLHWLTLFARALHWFNPFLHLAALRLRHECELAADATALQNSTPTERAAYGETLLHVLAQTTAPANTLSLTMAAERRHLEQRLRALTEPARHCSRLLGAALALTLAVSGLSRAVDPAPPADAPTSTAVDPEPKPAPQPTSIRLQVVIAELPPGKILALLKEHGIEFPSTVPYPTNFTLSAAQTALFTNAIITAGGDLISPPITTMQAGAESKFSVADEPALSEWIPGAIAPPRIEALFQPTADPALIDLTAQVLLTEFLGLQTNENRTLPSFRVRSTKANRPIAINESQAIYLPSQKRPPARLQDKKVFLSGDIATLGRLFRATTTDTNTETESVILLIPRSDEAKPVTPANRSALLNDEREDLQRELETIRIEHFALEKETALSNVVEKLNAQLKKQDSVGPGVEILISTSLGIRSGTQEIVNQTHPREFKIKFDAPLRNVTLRELLEAIANAAKPPESVPTNAVLNYAVTTGGKQVAFAQNTGLSGQLLTRTFAWTRPFKYYLDFSSCEQFPKPAPYSTNNVLADYFKAAGINHPQGCSAVVDLHTQKAFYLNNGLFVRATVSELTEIEKFLQRTETEPPQDATPSEASSSLPRQQPSTNLVQSARQLFEKGQLDEARKLLQEAIKIDPNDRIAFYYLNLIEEKRPTLTKPSEHLTGIEGHRISIKGTRASVDNGIMFVTKPHIQLFVADEAPDLIIDAADVLVDQEKNSDAWSAKEISMTRGDGNFTVKGVGFRWNAALSQLSISNQVEAIIRGMGIAHTITNQVATSTNATIRITADQMVYNIDSVVFSGHIHVIDQQSEFHSHLLKVSLGKNFEDNLGEKPHATATRPVQESKEPIATSTLVQDARLLIETGRLAEAEKLLREVVKADPENRAAFYYLSLITEQKYSLDGRKRNTLSAFGNAFTRTNQTLTSVRRQILHRKLESIRFDTFPLDQETELVEVLKILTSEVKKRDPDGRGVNVLISPAVFPDQSPATVDPQTGLPAAATAAPNIDVEKFKIRFDLPIREVTLRQLLDAIVTLAKPPPGAPFTAGIKYSVEDYAIVFSPKIPEPDQLYTRTFRFDLNAFREQLEDFMGLDPLQDIVANGGVGLPGVRVETPNQYRGTLWAMPRGTFSPNLRIITNFTSIQKEVRELFSLARIDLQTNAASLQAPVESQKTISYDKGAGSLVVRATLRDLDILENIIRLHYGPPQSPPSTPRASPQSNANASGSPQETSQPERLYTRVFNLDSNTFRQAREGIAFSQNGQGGFFTFGGGITRATTTTNLSSVQNEVRAFFSAVGVDFPTNAVAPEAAQYGAAGQPALQTKALFFKDQAGKLFVRATLRELDIIEQALQVLNAAPSQEAIAAKSADVSRTNNSALGFERFLGNTLITNGPTTSVIQTNGRNPALPVKRSANSPPQDLFGSTPETDAAQLLIQVGRNEEAKNLLRNFQKDNPGNPLAEQQLNQIARRNPSNTNQLFTRAFKLDPDTIARSLGLPTQSTNVSAILSSLRSQFSAAGIQFATNAQNVSTSPLNFDPDFLSPQENPIPESGPRKGMYYKGSGHLMIRATLADLDKIETVLHQLNASPRQIAFEVNFADLSPDLLPKFFEDIRSSRTLVTSVETLMTVTNGAAVVPPQLLASKQVAAKLSQPVTSSMVSSSAAEYIVSKALAKKLKDLAVKTDGVDFFTLPTDSAVLLRPARFALDEKYRVLSADSPMVDLGREVQILPLEIKGRSLQYRLTSLLPATRYPQPGIRLSFIDTTTQLPFEHTQILVFQQKDDDEAARSKASRKSATIVFVTATPVDSALNATEFPQTTNLTPTISGRAARHAVESASPPVFIPRITKDTANQASQVSFEVQFTEIPPRFLPTVLAGFNSTPSLNTTNEILSLTTNEQVTTPPQLRFSKGLATELNRPLSSLSVTNYPSELIILSPEQIATLKKRVFALKIREPQEETALDTKGRQVRVLRGGGPSLITLKPIVNRIGSPTRLGMAEKRPLASNGPGSEINLDIGVSVDVAAYTFKENSLLQCAPTITQVGLLNDPTRIRVISTTSNAIFSQGHSQVLIIPSQTNFSNATNATIYIITPHLLDASGNRITDQ